MASIDTYGGYTSAPQNQEFIVLADAIPTNFTRYWICFDTGGANDTPLVGPQGRDYNDMALFHVPVPIAPFTGDPVPGTYDLYLHDGPDSGGPFPVADRIAGPLTVTWTPSDGDPPEYITAAPVLAATVLDDRVRLEWTPATKNDARGEILYLLLRGKDTGSFNDSVTDAVPEPPQYIVGTGPVDDMQVYADSAYIYAVREFIYFPRGLEGTAPAYVDTGDALPSQALVGERIVDLGNDFYSNIEHVTTLSSEEGGVYGGGTSGTGGWLCGWNDVGFLEDIYLVVPGPVWVFQPTADGNPYCDVIVSGRYDPGPDGLAVIGFSRSGSGVATEDYWLHSSGFSGCYEPPPTSSHPRVTNTQYRVFGTSATWRTGGATPTYVQSPPVVLATPGNTVVDVAWNDANACDPILDVTYILQRSTTGPSSGFSSITGETTALSYHDTGRLNGTTYWYRVITRVRIRGHGSYGIIQSVTSDPSEAATPSGTSVATVVTLCGITTIKTVCNLTLLAEGLPPAHSFTWRSNGVSMGGGLSDADGRARFTYTNVLATTDAITITDGSGLLATGPTITWASIGTCPTYVGPAPTLSGAVHLTDNTLNWTASPSCDPRLVVHYEVYRRPRGAGSYTKLADFLSALTYVDEAVAPCDNFDYYVKAVASLYTAADTGTFGQLNSNVVALDRPCGTVAFDGVRWRASDAEPAGDPPAEPTSIGFDDVRWRTATQASGLAAPPGVDFSRVRYRIGDPE